MSAQTIPTIVTKTLFVATQEARIFVNAKWALWETAKTAKVGRLLVRIYLLFKVSKTTKIKLIKTETAYYKIRENVGIMQPYYQYY